MCPLCRILHASSFLSTAIPTSSQTAFLSIIFLSAHYALYVSTVQNVLCLISCLNCHSNYHSLLWRLLDDQERCNFFSNYLSICHSPISQLSSVCVHGAEYFMPHISSQLPFHLPFAFVPSSWWSREMQLLLRRKKTRNTWLLN